MNTTPIYVSPAGNDAWSGRPPDANTAGTDGPLRSLAGFATAAQRNDATAWRETGRDPEGVFADPLFLDPAKGDFRLLPDSPAFAMGFVPWAFEQAGPRGDLSPTQRSIKWPLQNPMS